CARQGVTPRRHCNRDRIDESSSGVGASRRPRQQAPATIRHQAGITPARRPQSRASDRLDPTLPAPPVQVARRASTHCGIIDTTPARRISPVRRVGVIATAAEVRLQPRPQRWARNPPAYQPCAAVWRLEAHRSGQEGNLRYSLALPPGAAAYLSAHAPADRSPAGRYSGPSAPCAPPRPVATCAESRVSVP